MLFFSITNENIGKLREKAREEEDTRLAALKDFVAGLGDTDDDWGLAEAVASYIDAKTRRQYLESPDPQGNAERYLLYYPREGFGSNRQYTFAKAVKAEALIDIARAEQTLTIAGDTQ